jgi:hypothetical protein
MERRPFGKWWNSHKLSQHVEERADVVYFGESLKLCEVVSFKNTALVKERQQSLSRAMK